MSADSLISGKNIRLQDLEYNTALTDAECVDYCILTTLDKKRFKVPRKLIQASEVIKDILLESEGVGTEIPIEVDTQTFKLIFEFIQFHNENPMNHIGKPLRKKFKDVVSQWDYEFCIEKLSPEGENLETSPLFKVLKASSSLLITPLKDLCCAFLASMIVGKSDADVRSLLNITDSIEKDDEAKLLKEYPWLFDKK